MTRLTTKPTRPKSAFQEEIDSICFSGLTTIIAIPLVIACLELFGIYRSDRQLICWYQIQQFEEIRDRVAYSRSYANSNDLVQSSSVCSNEAGSYSYIKVVNLLGDIAAAEQFIQEVRVAYPDQNQRWYYNKALRKLSRELKQAERAERGNQ